MQSQPKQVIIARHCADVRYWYNECIGDDTKAAPRQSLNCIKSKKHGKKRFSIWRMVFLHPAMYVARSWHWFRQVTASCNVACGSGIVTVNSPSSSTLHCDTWLWDDMPLNSPKRPPSWNSTSAFYFDHITAVDMSFCTSVRNFIQIRPTSVEKKLRHVDFQDGGSQPSCIFWIQ